MIFYDLLRQSIIFYWISMIFYGFLLLYHSILWYSMIFHDTLWTFMRLASFCTLVFDSSGDFSRRILGHLRSFAEAIASCQASSLDPGRVLVIAVASNKMAGIIFWCTIYGAFAMHCATGIALHCEGAILCSQALVLHDLPGSYDFPLYSVIFYDILWYSMVDHNIIEYFLWYSMIFYGCS